MRRTSYQQGSLKLAARKKGKVWEFRWREVQMDGSIRRKNIVIGTLEEFPNESAAQAAVDAIRLTVNKQTPRQLLKNLGVETLVKHYRQHELPDIFHHRKPETGPADEVIFNAVRVRGVPTKMDSSALAVLSSFRGESRRRRGVAQVHALSARQQGENSQSDERLVLARYSLGMGREESHHKRPAKCKTHACSRHTDSRRDHSIAGQIAGTSPDRLRTRRIYGSPSRRVDWAAMARRGFRESADSRSAIGCDDGRRDTKDRSLYKRCSSRCIASRIVAEAETHWTLQPGVGLGFRVGDDERQAALVARDTVAPPRTAGSRSRRHKETGGIPHVSTHVHDLAHPEQRGCESCARAVASCKQPNHPRPLCASGNAREAAGSKQAGRTDTSEGKGSGLSGPNWTKITSCRFLGSA